MNVDNGPGEHVNVRNPKRRRQHPPIAARPYYTLPETAVEIGVAQSTLRSWVRSDRANLGRAGYERKAPDFYHGGRLLLFRKPAVSAWLRDHTI